MHQPLTLVNRGVTLLAEPDRALAVDPDADPRRGVALGANDRHRRARHRPRLFQDAALGIGPVSPFFHVALDQSHPFDGHSISRAIDSQDLPAFARFALLRALSTRNDLHRVSDLQFLHIAAPLSLRLAGVTALPARVK